VVDADIDHIGCHVREPIIGAALLRGLRVIASRDNSPGRVEGLAGAT